MVQLKNEKEIFYLFIYLFINLLVVSQETHRVLRTSFYITFSFSIESQFDIQEKQSSSSSLTTSLETCKPVITVFLLSLDAHVVVNVCYIKDNLTKRLIRFILFVI
jgi:hypothetical protein